MTDVASLLKKYQESVPVNVEGFIRTVGAELKKDAELPKGISGQVVRNPEGRYVVSTAKGEHYFRQRFTMAHELGHLILHRSLLDRVGGVDDNVKYRSTTEGDIYNSFIDLVHERQANSFAANLLMPAEKVREKLDEFSTQGRTPTLKDMYQEFQVSRSAMEWRLKNLGLWERVAE